MFHLTISELFYFRFLCRAKELTMSCRTCLTMETAQSLGDDTDEHMNHMVLLALNDFFCKIARPSTSAKRFEPISTPRSQTFSDAAKGLLSRWISRAMQDCNQESGR